MGAENQSLIIKGGNETHVKRRIEAQYKNDHTDHGHAGYTGSWAEWNGCITFTNKTFKTEQLAYEYLFGKHSKRKGKPHYEPGIVQKWENAIAVQFRNDKGQINWLIGACFSC